MPRVKGLRERLRDNENIICAEGYMRELERRGYVQYGPNTPEVVLEYPDQVRSLHQEFVLAGSDVVEAFTYYGHRAKMRLIGRESDLERLNRSALRIAREVADQTGTLMAGNICNTCVYDPKDKSTFGPVKKMFEEQIRWAVGEGADYIIAETFSDFGEAKLALEAIQEVGKGLPAVVTLTAYCPDVTTDDIPIEEALRQLEILGADVVGLNCGRGPETMMPLLKKARKICKGPLAALPVPFRTSDKEITFQALKDPVSGAPAHPLDIDCCRCSRSDVRRFAKEARALGVQYVGLCCGSSSNMLREVAQEYGRTPAAGVYAPDMDKCTLAQARTAHVQKRQFFAYSRVYNIAT
ncbi:S-methylmethionine--homocysteine S-methyltransferase BHMT2 [Aplysia californica]|uniref:S-methylmethionine--homocysteine S-methyltransferase BHMT2 n=1 Tax=Aplysia californica TaxID=6500 RepID=A0ABM1ACC8_APLCA|nr:S-methylmethionine--homocysteine S-methyltransferase BHMT2 [Aplysia californica]